MKRFIFVHSAVDDAGLMPREFRVLGHLSRRAGSDGRIYSSIPNMAEVCGLSVGTVKIALRELKRLNIVVVDRRCGETSLRRINPPSEWKTDPVRKTSRVEKQPRTNFDPGIGTENLPGAGTKIIPQRVSKEGNPREGYRSTGLIVTTDGDLNNAEHSSANQLRLGKLFGRKETASWTPSELQSWRELLRRRDIDEEFNLIEKYYRLPDQKSGGLAWRRQSLKTLIENWSGELDHAHTWFASSQSGSLHQKEVIATPTWLPLLVEIKELLADAGMAEEVLGAKAEMLPKAAWSRLDKLTEWNRLNSIVKRFSKKKWESVLPTAEDWFSAARNSSPTTSHSS